MIVQPPKLNNIPNRIYEHLSITGVVFLLSFLVILFSPALVGGRRGRNSHLKEAATDGLTYLVENMDQFAWLCLGIAMVTNLVFFLIRFSISFISRIEFDDPSQMVCLHSMGLYSRTHKEVFIPYKNYSLKVERKKDQLFDGNFLLLTFFKDGKPAGNISTINTSWFGYKNLIDKIILKSDKIANA